jgi:hypothetical protein
MAAQGKRRRALQQQQQQQGLTALTVPLGRTADVGVSAMFVRAPKSKLHRLRGTVAVPTGSDGKPKGPVEVFFVFDDGTSARVAAKCNPAPVDPAHTTKLNCTWALDGGDALTSPKAGRVVAIVDGPSPAAVTQPAPFSFAKAARLARGACAAISATWDVAAGAGAEALAATLPQPEVAGDGDDDEDDDDASGGAAAPSSALKFCGPSKSYAYTLQVGPFTRTACGAQLSLVGKGRAVPTDGGRAAVASEGRAEAALVLTGCPGAAVRG